MARFKSLRSLFLLIPAAGLVVSLQATRAFAGHRHRSDAVVANGDSTRSTFCTDGDITVVHSAKADAAGSYSVGFTVLEGPHGTFELGEGSRVVPRGCYTHWLSHTVAIGRASVQSTVWYD